MNIFAEELEAILKAHKKDLGALYSMDSYSALMNPHKVTLLKRSLMNDMTTLLSVDELDMVQNAIPLDAEGREMQRLRAAMVAETIRFLVWTRLKRHANGTGALTDWDTLREAAYRIGRLTFQLFVSHSGTEMRTLSEQLLETIRDITPTSDGESTSILTQHETTPLAQSDAAAVALAPAADLYGQATLWIELGRESEERSARQAYAAHASTLLSRAQKLVQYPQTVAQGSDEQRDLSALINAAIEDAKRLQ